MVFGNDCYNIKIHLCRCKSRLYTLIKGEQSCDKIDKNQVILMESK